jgi:hypothetical protein
LRQAQAGFAAAGPIDRGAQSFRPSGDAASPWVDTALAQVDAANSFPPYARCPVAKRFFTQSVIVAKDVAARERLREKQMRFLVEDFPSATSRMSPLELGPPVSIQIVKNHDQPFLVVAG